jgi:hypothetical protein
MDGSLRWTGSLSLSSKMVTSLPRHALWSQMLKYENLPKQGCQIFLGMYNIPKWKKHIKWPKTQIIIKYIQQMTVKCSKWPLYSISAFFIPRNCILKFGFLVCKHTIWHPCSKEGAKTNRFQLPVCLKPLMYAIITSCSPKHHVHRYSAGIETASGPDDRGFESRRCFRCL